MGPSTFGRACYFRDMVQVVGLDGRVAIVTGAARGIGRAIAEGLAGNGAMVAALDLEAPDLPGIIGYRCDVSDETAVDVALSAVEQELGAVSVAVLNAGIFHIVPFEETSTELWERTLAVNLTGAFLCAGACCRGCARGAGGGSS